MTSDNIASLNMAAAGLRAQTARMKVIAENIANAQSTATTPGGNPYTRQIPVFSEILNRNDGLKEVKMTKVVKDKSDYVLKYDPTNPAADKSGMVKMPNVQPLLEAMDMRDAQRAYEANLGVIDNTRSMMSRTLDIIKK